MKILKRLIMSASILFACSAGAVFADPRLDLYHSALLDLKRNDTSAFLAKKQQLVDFPLYPYLEYQEITKVFDLNDEPAVKSFIFEYPNSSLARKLQTRWLNLLKSKQRWNDILTFSEPSTQSHRCLYYYAQLKIQQPVSDSAIESIWLAETPQSGHCQHLLALWDEQVGLDDQLVWERFKQAMQERRIEQAKQIRVFMNAEQQKSADRWLKIYSQPNLINTLKLTDTEAHRDMIVSALRRMASRSPTTAVNKLKSLSKHYQFSNEQRYRVYSRVAVRYATRQDKRAEKWFAKIPPESMGPVLRQWYMRSAIAHSLWADLVKRYKSLPEDDQQLAVWRFWKAYSHRQLKQYDQANRIFNELIDERHYYALLAREILNKPLKLHHQRPFYSQQELNEVANNPHILRAQWLYQAKKKYLARSEWNSALQTLDNKQQYLAAVLANQWGWHHNAIYTLSQLPDQHDLTIRFPLVHAKKIKAVAEKNALNPATIFAISRIESTFQANAQSPVGARGIMQLMPNTAKRYFKRLKLNKSQQNLFHVPTNLLIGSTHYAQLLKHLKGNAVAAIAAYNAGLHNVKRWLRLGGHRDPIVWIELIPFHETRQYVKRVIIYSAIYHYHLKREFDLSTYIKKL